MKRRDFVKLGCGSVIAGCLPVSMVNLAFGAAGKRLSFACISDSHIRHVRGREFTRKRVEGLKRAVAETNALAPKPDFVVFGGDLAQLGTRAELDHGAELLAGLNCEVRMVVGEHDYYLDLGEHWSQLFGPQRYSFNHKGVHFVVLNSILTSEDWTLKRWESGARRMAAMAGLDNPEGSPFMVGERQREWLRKDLEQVNKDTPVVVFSHSPIQKIHRGWNFWTEDAKEVQAILKPFDRVNVIYGHVHQIQYNQIGNIAFNSVMATSWPWPYPEGYAMAESHLPVLALPMNRDDPFDERNATGWQFMNVHSGRVDLTYQLNTNDGRLVRFDGEAGHPADAGHC